MLEANLRLRRHGIHINCNFTINRGVSALFGPSGAGKTSILRLIAGLEKGDADTTIYFNQQPWQLAKHWLAPHRRGVGMVFQRPNLFGHLSVAENIQFAAKRPFQTGGLALNHIIDLCGIGSLLPRHPRSLSGGEQQRVAIARTLAYQPQLLLLDEPLSNIDTTGRTQLLGVLSALKPELDLPIVYVSHQRDELYQFADDIYLIQRGSIIEHGNILTLSVQGDSVLNQQAGSQNLWQGYLEQQADDGLSLVRIEPELALWLPTPATSQRHLRVSIPASALSLSLSRPSGSSIINCLPATIEHIQALSPSHCRVTLSLGQQQRLHAIITQRSATALGLCAAMPIFAQIKGINIVTL